MISTVNPFSPTTTGGKAGQYVYNKLSTAKTYENESLARTRSAKYEAEDQEKLNNYIVVLKALDQEVLNKIQIINNKKQEIVTIIGNVFTTKSSTNPLRSSTSFTDPIAEKVVYMAGISTFSYNCGGFPVTCSVGVRGQIFPDIFAAWNYPKVESLDVSNDFYRQGETYVGIGTTNVGIGVTAYDFGEEAGATGTIGLVTTSNASLGYYYFWSNLSSVDAGAATSISNLVDDIENLRIGISSSLSDSENGSNKIRGLKSQTNINLWFEKKGQTAAPLADYQGGMNSLESNSTTIQNYNS